MTLTRVILVLTKPVSGRKRNRRTFSPNFSEQPNGDLERGQIEKFPPNNKQGKKERKTSNIFLQFFRTTTWIPKENKDR